jgi:signal transduction histidine kinase
VGVGLAIARRIVQGFQGEIQLQEPGQRIGGVVFEGAIFSMRIARRAAG